METQKTPNSQNNLKKEEQTWRHHAPSFQTILQSYSNQNSMVLAQRHRYQWNRIENAQINSVTYIVITNTKKKVRIYSGEKTPSSINAVQKTGQLDEIELNLTNFPHHLCMYVCLFRTSPTAYGVSQARGSIRAVSAGLCQSHSNSQSKP